MALAQNLQASFTGGELAPSLHARVDLAKYRTGAKKLQNWIIHAHGGISRRDGLRFVGEAGNGSQPVRLIGFEASSSDTYILEFGHLYMRVYRNGGIVALNGNPFTLSLPYTGSQLHELVIEQSNDVLTVTHPSHAPREISRYADNDWRVAVLNFAPPTGGPSSVSVSTVRGYTVTVPPGESPSSYYMAETYRYRVTAVLDDGQETLPSDIGSADNDLRWYPLNSNTLSWSDISGALFYNIYKQESGVYGLIGTATGTSFVDKNYKGDTSQTPPSGRNPFNTSTKYPRASAFFQQRRVFGGTIKNPQTSWATISGNYYNFTASRPAKDSDALEFTVAGRKLQKIRHYVAMNDLIVFTESGEWRVIGTDGGVITPTGSLKASLQSEYGIGDVPPLVVGDQILFVQRSGKQVRDLGYKFESDNYSGSDLTLLSSHLFKTRRVIGWAHQQNPHGIIWCVMDDGTLNALTYLREHEVWGWSQHITDGFVESVAVVSENHVHVPYFLVRRIVGGVSRRYIERMVPNPSGAREDGFFVDSGLPYHGPAISTVLGLQHLEGRTVVGLADGAVVGLDGELVVSGGSVTLPFAASKIVIGLGYESLFESLSLSLNDRVTEGLVKAVGEVSLAVEGTTGIEVGGSWDDLNEHKARSFEDYGTAPELKTETIGITAGSDYDISGGRVCVRQRYPLPTTILSIAPKIDYAG